MLISFRVKHAGSAKDTIAVGEGQNVLGLRVLGYENLEAGASGYGQVAEIQLPFTGLWNGLPSDMLVPMLVDDGAAKTGGADWTQYAFVWYPTPESEFMEIRLSYWHQFTGASYWDDIFIVPVGDLSVGVGVEDEIVDGSVPTRINLHQNYPNPFNPVTTIAFDLKEQSEVSLSVYNVMGQKVANLLSSQILAAGTQRVQFNANELPSGTYLYVLEVDDMRVAHKMVLLK